MNTEDDSLEQDIYQLFLKMIKYEGQVEDVRKALADRPDFDPLQCYVELHRPRNKELCYKHFQVFFDSKSISHMQRDLDYITLTYSDKNDYKMKEHNFYDIILTHTDFMSCQIILGRQKQTFSAIIGTMHFKTQDLFIDLFKREIEQYRQVEKAKMTLFDKRGFSLFKHPLFSLSPLKFNDLVAFMLRMKEKELHESNTGEVTEQMKEEINETTESLWRRMHQNNRKKYTSKVFTRLREFVTPQDYFENASIEKPNTIKQNLKQIFNPEKGHFEEYTTLHERGKKKIDSYSEPPETNPWRTSEHMPINIKFNNNLHDQKTHQGDHFTKEFIHFHSRQLRQNQFI